MTSVRTISVAAIAVMAILAFPLKAAPTIEVTSTGLRATGITAGADAVWFGATIHSMGGTPLLKSHKRVIRDDDRDGAVLFEMSTGSRYALLFVVDSTTGEHAVHRGAGVDGTQLQLPDGQWRAGIEQFDATGDTLHILLVQPGTGAWTTKAIEGSSADGDGVRNRKFRLKVKDMQPIAGDAKPQGNVRRGDLLVIVDPYTLAYAVRTAAE